jgi:Flp pilus assembly protein TadG
VTSARRNRQSGQSIVLIALVLTVLFGFVGLAIDSGRGYLDRRHVQGSVDAAALAAAFDYMNNHDYAQAETAAVNQFANNERLYGTPTCAGIGSVSASCTFGDPGNTALTLNVADHSIAGVSFRATATHRVGIAMMQVLGFGSTMGVGATATAVARPQGQNGAAIQTLSPGSCASGSPSLVFTGTSTTAITGDVWSNGSINDNGSAGGTVNGNVINICPTYPPTAIPNFTVTGTQATGFNIPDPGYPQQTLDPTARSWNSTNGSAELPGTYAADPHLTGSAGCYFLSGGVYNLAGGFTQNAGFVSNVLRPPDEPNMASAGTPNMTTLNGSLSGTITRITVDPLPGAISQGSVVSVGGQQFTVSSNSPAGDDDINVSRQTVSGTISDGSTLTVRANPQFWDSNGVSCSGTFSVSSPGSGSMNGGTYSVEVTAVRWQANGVATCSGPASPTCYLRESAPSMCKTLSVGNSGNLKVNVDNLVPGATDYKIYAAHNGSCSGLTYCSSTGGNASVTISNCASGTQPPPPDGEGMPMGANLPNADPAPAAPPNGDLANSGHCVDPLTGANASCPSGWTVGAVQFFIPGGGSNSVCLNLQGGGDIWIYSGYQYQRILLFEPGPAQPPPYNTCLNNVAGHGITNLNGIFYAPAASMTIIGSSSYLATIAGGVIAWTATVKGNGGVSIMADPTLRTWPSAVRLTN